MGYLDSKNPGFDKDNVVIVMSMVSNLDAMVPNHRECSKKGVDYTGGTGVAVVLGLTKGGAGKVGIIMVSILKHMNTL